MTEGPPDYGPPPCVLLVSPFPFPAWKCVRTFMESVSLGPLRTFLEE